MHRKPFFVLFLIIVLSFSATIFGQPKKPIKKATLKKAPQPAAQIKAPKQPTPTSDAQTTDGFNRSGAVCKVAGYLIDQKLKPDFLFKEQNGLSLINAEMLSTLSPNYSETLKDGITPVAAQKISATIKAVSPNWYEYLPCCPNTIREMESKYGGIYEEDGRGAKLVANCFHKGAATCYRSDPYVYSSRYSPSVKTETKTTRYHGQQCCYDRKGDLITNGTGAGTPDFFAPLAGNVDVDEAEDSETWNEHILFDVLPFMRLTTSAYHQTWKPNAGCNQAPIRWPTPDLSDASVSTLSAERFSIVPLYVRKGDELSFSEASGEVILDSGGEKIKVGPEGTNLGQKRGFDAMLNSPLVGDVPVGALIGAVYLGDLLSEDAVDNGFDWDYNKLSSYFLIGSGRKVTMPDSGYLLLTLNDQHLLDNRGSFEVKIEKTTAVAAAPTEGVKSPEEVSRLLKTSVSRTNNITKLSLKKGDKVRISASGAIVLGFFAGESMPAGINGMREYNVIPNAPHGALLMRVNTTGSEAWEVCGEECVLTAKNSGKLEFRINDSDPNNNTGQYEVTVSKIP